MVENSQSSRRTFLKYGGTVAGSAVLAGCVGGVGDESDSSGGSTDDAVGASNGSEDGSNGGSDGDPYAVSMEPTGEVTFESVPERWVSYKSGYGDMGVALGVGDGMVGTDIEYGSFDVLSRRFYDQLPGFEFGLDGVTDIRGGGENVDKEVFYEMDADVHLMDPNLPKVYFEWDDADTEEIAENVAPFVGNFNRRKRDDSWGESYQFYTLYEAFEKVAQVFQREERYEAFAELHDEVQAEIADALPPENERPSIGLLNGGSDPANGELYVMDPTAKGYEMKQYRDLGIRNAFEGAETGEHGLVDYETALEYDPEIIVFHWGVTYEADEFAEQFVEPMRNHEVGRELTAVKEGNLYPGGTAEQGPLINLFQTEMLAQQQYPETFGEFPGLGEEPEETLFDRQRVADIVAGEF
ncbi:ABC transporter substrate-binding protein [Haloprofundus halobius]|uniref:ABC transporter substrate-binding protein n=1 Tax=Haloprofundus halobius TaxID=2876194 RepID=UPI001CCF99A6|nr:ABC transporter substrate-binding protein [Haloprofundus halobius]